MKIVNEILLKIWEKLKNNFFLKILNLEKTCWKLERNYVHRWKCERMRLIIRAGARFAGTLRQNIFKITAFEKFVANLI